MNVSLKKIDLPERGSYEYAEAGQGEMTAVMLHGYLDSWYSFHGMMLELSASLKVFSLSQRGHGESPKPEEGYRIEHYAEDAIAFMDKLGLKKVILVGHSMGTFIAQEVTLRRPDLVDKLVLIAAGLTGDSHSLRAFHREAEKLKDPITREFAYDFQASTCVNPLGEGMELSQIVDETMKVPAHVYDKALAGLITYRSETCKPEKLNIRCPTLSIWGDRDDIFLRETQDDLISAIPDSKLMILNGVGHGVQWEYPDLCSQALLNFCGFNDT